MTKINSPTWTIEPHTEAKHAILRKYLDAWLPIITRWNGKVIYIDGFAGPGKYSSGQDGSPIIAIKAVLEHRTEINAEIKMLFIEKDKEICSFLKQKVDKIKLPSNLNCECVCSRFDEKLTEILDYIDEQKQKLAPAFVFIDPFGFSGIPFSLIKRIMLNPSCEVLITFMYEEINRFIRNKSLWSCLTETFGTEEWKKVIREIDPEKRTNMLHNIYEDQLTNEAGIKFIRSFKMINKLNKTDYFLFFGTNHISGLKKMKEAMWKVDESGLFEFSDATYNPAQPILFEKEPNYQLLKKILLKNFENEIVSVEELENFILTQTPFRETHYKRQILRPMEKAKPPEIKIISNKPRRKGISFTADCLVEFL